jgi:HAD superfamily hydrolase (TIGR01509 family)
LLLDFGGVIAESERAPVAPAPLVALLHELVDGALSPELIQADLHAGAIAYERWRDATARWYAPAEITHAQFWGDFVCADWPGPARATVLERASELAYRVMDRGPAWRLRPGVVDVLDEADAAGIPLAIVSNTLCGASFRDFLATVDLGDRFTAQLYSDEVGLRKPNPAIVRAGAEALGLPVADCWFVGDTPLRDVLAGRRAGVGCCVLVRSDRELQPGPSDPRVAPDVTLESMVEVHELLRQVCARAPVAGE